MYYMGKGMLACHRSGCNNTFHEDSGNYIMDESLHIYCSYTCYEKAGLG